MPHSVMIFAAGFGTRMGQLTQARPKPLIEVAGMPLIEHALALCDKPWIRQKVVNVHYMGDAIRAHLSGRDDIRISDETGEILETGGGLRKALPLLGPDPVISLNSDAVWSDQTALDALASAWDPDRMDALLLVVPKASTKGYTGTGDFTLLDNGQLRRGGEMVYTGAQILRTDGLSDMPDGPFSLNLLWDRIAATGRFHGVTYTGLWADVGTPAGIREAEAMLEGGA